MYKLFDSCKLDNKWKRIGKATGKFHDYKSTKDNARIELHIQGIESETYNFKKNAIINLQNSIIQYRDKDLIQ